MDSIIRADVLAKLLRIHETLDVLPDYPTIADFLQRALGEIPGVLHMHLYVEGVVFPSSQLLEEICTELKTAGDTSSENIGRGGDNSLIVTIPLQSACQKYGKLILCLYDKEAFSPYLAFVQNIANALVATLETREHIRLLDENKIGLEAKIAESTAALRASQELLCISEERLLLATQAGGIGIWDYDPVNDVLVWDDSMFALYGIAKKDFSGAYDAWQSLLHPADRSRGSQEVQYALLGIRPFDTEFRASLPNGDIRHIKAKGQVFRDGQGKAIRIVGVNWDITERILAEKERVRLLSIIEDAPDFIATSDMQAHLKYLNLAGAKMVGLPAKAGLSGLEIKDMHPVWGTRKVMEEGIPTVLSQGYWQGENALLNRDGHEISVSQLLLVHRDASGNPEFLSTIMRDITAFKQIEAALKNLNEALEHRVWEETEKNRQKDAILIQQSRSAAMGEMIGNIAHQWRQPLNALGLILANIKDAAYYKELTPEYLESLVRDGERLIQKMSTTIDDFRNFFRPQKRQEPFNLGSAIKEALSLVDARFRNNNIEFKLELEEDILIVGFANEFSQVLINLLNNAQDAILSRHSPNGSVTVRLCRDALLAVVTVTDNGGGIPPAVMEKMFEPYFSTKKMGTGIGLYMSKMIIEKSMRGTLSVRNVDGGTEFTVSLPSDNVIHPEHSHVHNSPS